MSNFSHISVLLNEAVDGLNIKPGGVYIDGTTGGGGHSYEIAKRLTDGRLICVDRDPDAIAAAKERLKEFECITFVNDRFSEVKSICNRLEIDRIDGMILDLGVSSYQLDTAERGFSYHMPAPLDMRMSKEGMTAADLVNTLSEQELANIIYKYSDERLSRKIASAIVEARKIAPIETTDVLAQLISDCYPAKLKKDGHPARRTFQSLRIAVNGEMREAEQGINDCFELLNEGGRISVITFHSIEDRLVKQCFAAFCKGCECPPDFPVCVCGKKPRAQLVNRKPITASKEELEVNSRSRSAKLRILEKL